MSTKWLVVSVGLVACSTDERERDDETVVKISYSGGVAAQLQGATSVWPDGRVRFKGPKCDEAGRRLTVPRDRIATLVGEIILSGALSDWFEQGCDVVPDGFSADVSVTLDELRFTRSPSLDCPWVVTLQAALDRAAGKNTCVW